MIATPMLCALTLLEAIPASAVLGSREMEGAAQVCALLSYVEYESWMLCVLRRQVR